MRIKLAAAFALSLAAQAASASPVNYVCKMTQVDGRGWIAPVYLFQVDSEKGTAQVVDKPEWIDARFKNRGAKGYRMSWNLTSKTTEGPNVRVRYQANLDPKDNSIKVRMAFANVGAANKPYGTGKCETE